MTLRFRARLPSGWKRITHRICRDPHARVAIFLDFDGTLVDIAPRPELVRLKPAVRAVLQRLSRLPRVSVILISGRRRAELVHHIGIRGISYFGLYGWESSTGTLLPASSTAALRRARQALAHHLHDHPDAWIEDKKSSLSIHLLDVAVKKQRKIRQRLRRWLHPFRKDLRAQKNLRDIEILPRSIRGKGAAVRRLLAAPRLRNAIPFYFGDDLSDESGFVAVRKGISVHVGKRRATQA